MSPSRATDRIAAANSFPPDGGDPQIAFSRDELLEYHRRHPHRIEMGHVARTAGAASHARSHACTRTSYRSLRSAPSCSMNRRARSGSDVISVRGTCRPTSAATRSCRALREAASSAVGSFIQRASSSCQSPLIASFHSLAVKRLICGSVTDDRSGTCGRRHHTDCHVVQGVRRPPART